MLSRIRRLLIARRLRASLRPDPDYYRRRLAQLPPERRARAMMSAGMHSPELFDR